RACGARAICSARILRQRRVVGVVHQHLRLDRDDFRIAEEWLALGLLKWSGLRRFAQPKLRARNREEDRARREDLAAREADVEMSAVSPVEDQAIAEHAKCWRWAGERRPEIAFGEDFAEPVLANDRSFVAADRDHAIGREERREREAVSVVAEKKRAPLRRQRELVTNLHESVRHPLGDHDAVVFGLGELLGAETAVARADRI